MAIKKIILLIVFLAIGGTIASRRKGLSVGDSIRNWQAWYFVSVSRDRGHICGGALISERHVLTASRCASDSRHNFNQILWVYIGEDKENVKGTRHLVACVRTSDEGTPAPKGGDHHGIAVLTLSAPVDLGITQNIIHLVTAKPQYCGIAAFVGFENKNLPSDAADLRRIKVEIFHPHQCTCEAEEAEIPGILCGRSDSPVEFFEGNVGGPIVYNEELVGLFSHQASNLEYHVYMDIFHFKKFIQKEMKRSLDSCRK